MGSLGHCKRGGSLAASPEATNDLRIAARDWVCSPRRNGPKGPWAIQGLSLGPDHLEALPLTVLTGMWGIWLPRQAPSKPLLRVGNH